ncbi:MAG: hypothetical protein CVU65_15105, partial [Deltaproteobacteria bacterium HGW-Deltaproteobacteria-22]
NFNLAQCHRQLRQWEKAPFFFRRFLSSTEDENLIRLARMHLETVERELERERKAREHRRLVATSRLTVLSNPPGAKVWAEGRLQGVTPCTLPLVPGKQTVVARLPGHGEARRTFVMPPDTAMLWEPELIPELPLAQRAPAWVFEQPLQWMLCQGAGCPQISGGPVSGFSGGFTALRFPRAISHGHLHPTIGWGPTFLIDAVSTGDAGGPDFASFKTVIGGLQIRASAPLGEPVRTLLSVFAETGFAATWYERRRNWVYDDDEEDWGAFTAFGFVIEFPVALYLRLGLTGRMVKFAFSRNAREYRGASLGITWSFALPWNP